MGKEQRLLPVLPAKLRPRINEGHYIHRARLLELVDDLAAAPLILVVAPAGTGKTSLLSDWAKRTRTLTAWLALDETDSDPAQFWFGVIAALEAVAPGCAGQSQGLLRRRDGAMMAVARLLFELEAVSGPDVVLIIDDLQLVDDDKTIARSLAQFVQHLPAWLHVVLLSRRQSRLPLGRLRARGQLGELSYAELRFSHDEAIELASRLLPSMPADQMEIVADRADGWAACVQFAAIAGRSEQAQRDRDLPGVKAEVQVFDYVFQEVLAGEEPDLVDALMEVSVVHRVSPSQAQALTGRADAVDLLLTAEARGLFVQQVAREGWFELHPLVRDAAGERTGPAVAGPAGGAAHARRPVVRGRRRARLGPRALPARRPDAGCVAGLGRQRGRLLRHRSGDAESARHRGRHGGDGRP